MRCPFCLSSEVRVVDSRDTEGGAAVRRRRQCTTCEQRFTTFERIEGSPLVVIKRDGTREPFDRAKVVSGIAKACKNRPVTDDQMLAICDAVEEAAQKKGAEIASTDIGRVVLERLEGVDEVAYVRFASVYRDFSDLSEFERVIAELERTEGRGTVGGQG